MAGIGLEHTILAGMPSGPVAFCWDQGTREQRTHYIQIIQCYPVLAVVQEELVFGRGILLDLNTDLKNLLKIFALLM